MITENVVLQNINSARRGVADLNGLIKCENLSLPDLNTLSHNDGIVSKLTTFF